MDTLKDIVQIIWSAKWLLAFLVLNMLIGWKTFEKAGVAGWKSLIPIYNLFVATKIVFGKAWYGILFFVPIVGFIFYLMYSIKKAEVYSQSAALGVLGIFFPIALSAIIAFTSSAIYVGPLASDEEVEYVYVDEDGNEISEEEANLWQ